MYVHFGAWVVQGIIKISVFNSQASSPVVMAGTAVLPLGVSHAPRGRQQVHSFFREAGGAFDVSIAPVVANHAVHIFRAREVVVRRIPAIAGMALGAARQVPFDADAKIIDQISLAD